MKIILFFVLVSVSAFGQLNVDNKNLEIDQTITYINRITSISTLCVNDPEKSEYKKELNILIQTYDKIKENLLPVLIIRESEIERKKLGVLIDNYGSNHEKLIDELLLWKYKHKEIPGAKIVQQFDELVNKASEIALNLMDIKGDSSDTVSILLSEVLLEDEVLPLSTDLIGKLNSLKKIK